MFWLLEKWKPFIIQRCKLGDSRSIPGNFLGFLMGTNFAPIASAIGGPNMNPLASTPAHSINIHNWLLVPTSQDIFCYELPHSDWNL